MSVAPDVRRRRAKCHCAERCQTDKAVDHYLRFVVVDPIFKVFHFPCSLSAHISAVTVGTTIMSGSATSENQFTPGW